MPWRSTRARTGRRWRLAARVRIRAAGPADRGGRRRVRSSRLLPSVKVDWAGLFFSFRKPGELTGSIFDHISGAIVSPFQFSGNGWYSVNG